MEDAVKSLKRLGRKDKLDAGEAVHMIKRTVDLEVDQRDPSLLDLWKGVNAYRTGIVCFVYAAQNLTGNLIANQAVYFFKRK
jgi:SP family general alpha glucoside:H+ symporter-like MFS transporter